MNNPPPRTYSRLAAVWIVWWSLWSAIFVIIVITEVAGADPSASGILGGMIGAALTAVLAAARVVAGRSATRRPVQAAKPQPALPAAAARRLPGKNSAAWQPMQRLAGAETALRDLLRQLGDAVPRNVVDAAWRTAAETADRLRVLAAKIEAVESAVAHAPAGQQAGLADGTRNLLAHIERGVDGYQELVAAAGHLVLADSANPVTDGLIEAIDHLAGLAAALRELSRGA